MANVTTNEMQRDWEERKTMQLIIDQLFQKADQAVKQIDEKATQIAAATFQVQNKMIEMQKKLETAQLSFPDILAAQILGEVDNADVEECRQQISILRQSIFECGLTLPILELRQNQASAHLQQNKPTPKEGGNSSRFN